MIHSYRELMSVFGARFITCSRVSQPIDSLLTVTMKGKPYGLTLTSIENCTMTLEGVTIRWQLVPLE